MIITSLNGVNKKIREIHHSVNGVNKKIGKVYHSVSSVNKCVFKKGYNAVNISHLKTVFSGSFAGSTSSTGVSKSYTKNSLAVENTLNGTVYIVFNDGTSIPFNADWSRYFLNSSITFNATVNFSVMIIPSSTMTGGGNSSTSYEFLGSSCPLSQAWNKRYSQNVVISEEKSKTDQLTITNGNNNSARYYLYMKAGSGDSGTFSFSYSSMRFADRNGTTPNLEMKYTLI